MNPPTESWPFPPSAFHVMVKPRGSICNLDCQYCFYLKKEALYPQASFRMTPDLLEKYILQQIDAQKSPEVPFAWQGGEPTLMGVDFFHKAVELQAKYRRPGQRIQNAFQTNGILIDDEWCEFFHQHDFLVGLSIDGPQELHDVYRRDKGGGSTFARVMRAAGLLKKHNVEFNTLTCVSAANGRHGLEVYRFLRDDLGSRFIQFIPIVELDNPSGARVGSRVTSRSIYGQQYGAFLIEVFDEWVRKDVGKVFVQIFDASLAAWAGEQAGLCIFGETCGLALAMEFNGDIYSCDHFVEPQYLLGNIQQQSLQELVMAPRQYQFGTRKKSALPQYCHDCEVLFICNGGCPKDRILRAPDNQPGLNYLCAGYRSFFNYIDKPMMQMGAYLMLRKAPAEIMTLMGDTPRLNEILDGGLCPCGNGKPVEQCHRNPQGFMPRGHILPSPGKLASSRRRH